MCIQKVILILFLHFLAVTPSMQPLDMAVSYSFTATVSETAHTPGAGEQQFQIVDAASGTNNFQFKIY